MAAVSRCPEPKLLQQLLLGRLSEEAADGLERHVEQCDRCSRLLPSLSAEDTLVQTMRARERVSWQPRDQSTIQDLLPRLRALRPAGASALDSTPGGPSQEKNDLRSTKVAALDFLRPPQAAGELGRLGPYRVLNVLGAGGMGVVFLAEDPQLQRTVALKVMRPEAAKKAYASERFLREARATAKIEHDHIVTIFQVGEDHGIPYLAMQLLQGMSLHDFIKKKHGQKTGMPLSLDQLLKLGREVAKGLAAAHDKGLIHRDIKPANIWLDASASGRVKILDFGLARAADGNAPLTQIGTVLGTAAYMAPEQARSDRIDGRADLFSLGCVLYQLCTGRLPWNGSDPTTTIIAVATEEPIPVQVLNPDLPVKLAEFIMQLLAKKPEDRPASARAVVEVIQAFERDRPALATQITLPPGTTPAISSVSADPNPAAATLLINQPRVDRIRIRRRSKRWLGFCAGIAALVIAVLLLHGLTSTDSPLPGTIIANSIGLKLAYIPPGNFLMGTSATDLERIKKEPQNGYLFPGWEKSETPQHEVRITKGFYLGAYEVSQGEYEKVIGNNPSANKGSPEHPVERVSWDDAVAFCQKLSALPEEKKAGRVYRLPTEAEWEYACRAGTTTMFNTGNSLSFKQAHIDADHPFGTAEKGPRIFHTVKVGSHAPNGWGLYDMHGNVWEWCLDGPRIYSASAVADPRGPTGSAHVLRGGSWRDGAVRIAFRKPRELFYTGNYVGFRVLCER